MKCHQTRNDNINNLIKTFTLNSYPSINWKLKVKWLLVDVAETTNCTINWGIFNQNIGPHIHCRMLCSYLLSNIRLKTAYVSVGSTTLFDIQASCIIRSTTIFDIQTSCLIRSTTIFDIQRSGIILKTLNLLLAVSSLVVASTSTRSFSP